MDNRDWNSAARTELEEHYAALLDEQEESGLSVSAFAEQEGLSAATLYSWRRRLRRSTAQNSTVPLVEVCVDDEVDPPPVQMVVVISDGTRIELSPDFDESALERLLGVLDRC